MFLDFYRFREQPFGETPDPRYLYLSTTHREAIASLGYGIGQGRGFQVLVAQPGMGKTTVLFHLLEWLRESARTVFLFQTQCRSRELLRSLLTDLGIDAQGQDFAWMHERLKELLVSEARAGRRLVLFIDEAQNLTESVLETVRLLSNFENPRSKLMQITLAGQPQLADKLARPELAQLRQRVSICCRLNPFTPSETDAYISHRLAVAGSDGRQIFTPEAGAMIAEWSQGIPRSINVICFNALSLGFAMGKREIDRAIVEEAIADLEISPVVNKPCYSQPSGVASALQKIAVRRQEEIAAGHGLAPSSRPQLKPLIAPRALGDTRATIANRSRQRTMALGGFALVAFCVFGGGGAFFLHRVMGRSGIMNSVPGPTVAQAINQSAKQVETSAGATSPFRLPPTAPKENPVPSTTAFSGQIFALPEPTPPLPLDKAASSPLADLTDPPAEMASRSVRGITAPGSNDLASSPRTPAANAPGHSASRTKEPQVVSQTLPAYPPVPRRTGVEGMVVIDAMIDIHGRPTNLRILSGPKSLRHIALDSVRERNYEPGYLHGQPVPVEAHICVDFPRH